MKLKIAIPSLAAALLAALPAANAQNATTDPVGFVTTNITASRPGAGFAITPISPVLLEVAGTSGATIGTLSSVGNNTVTVNSGNWTTNQLSSSAAYFLFKSGSLEGLMLRITSNTPTTATLDTLSANLSTLGAQAGDSFQLIQGDTLLSMFGTPSNGVVGGTSTQFNAGTTDRVQTRDSTGTVRNFYFDTGVNQWRRIGSSLNQGAVPISPTSGVFYFRIGQTPITQLTTGNVPVTSVKYLVPTSGTTFFSRFFPTSGTIGSFGFQNLPGWTSQDRVTTTDAAGTVRNYTWNGTQWRRTGSSLNQSNTAVPIGGVVSVTRFGSGPAQLLSVQIPYNLASQ